MKTIALAALMITVAGAGQAMAQTSSCGGSLQSGMSGATLGAVVGADKNRVENAILGAIIGYGVNAVACNRQYQQGGANQGANQWPRVQGYQPPQPQRYQPGYYAPVAQEYGVPQQYTPPQQYAPVRQQQPECGRSQIMIRNPDGTVSRIEATMCRINGEWQMVNNVPNTPPAYEPSSYAPPACAENGSCYGDISQETGRAKTQAVRGYTRKDGTYVRGYYRSTPR